MHNAGYQDTERRRKSVKAIPRVINKAVPLQKIPAAAEGNVVILPGVVRKQGKCDWDSESHDHDQPFQVSPLHTAKRGSMTDAFLINGVTENRSHWLSSRAELQESRYEALS